MKPHTLIAVLTLSGCVSIQAEQLSGENPFVGAWIIIQTTVTTPTGSRVDENPQPGLYIFTDRHFSNMLIPNEKRSLLSSERTDAERLAAYQNFIADAGTYEFTDSQLTVQNIIAKVPNAMPETPGERRPGRGIVYRYHFEGDSLVLTFDRGWAPPGGEITYRLDRLE